MLAFAKKGTPGRLLRAGLLLSMIALLRYYYGVIDAVCLITSISQSRVRELYSAEPERQSLLGERNYRETVWSKAPALY